jgi:hypothetical protein
MLKSDIYITDQSSQPFLSSRQMDTNHTRKVNVTFQTFAMYVMTCTLQYAAKD